MITAVTTCMGRLNHLEITLPLMLNEFDSVIVVDWSCPQRSGEFALELGATVVFQPGQAYFSRSGARNLGAGLVDSDYICMVDADIMCMPGLKQEIASLIDDRTMVFSSRTKDGFDTPDTFGFIVCPTKSFQSVKGYSEEFKGWGHEDSHLRGKLLFEAGLSPKRLDGMSIGAIAHGNHLRDINHEDNIYHTASVNYGLLCDYFNTKGISDWERDPKTEGITFVRS